jgi:thiol-disulfide isomerase/thioredoxin
LVAERIRARRRASGKLLAPTLSRFEIRMTAHPAARTDAPAQRSDAGWLVACLCARWCNTCEAYRITFAQVAAQMATKHPALHFVWVDIEDDADTLGDAALEVENFPTLMLLQHGRPLFFGTLLPHASTLSRTLTAALAGDLAGAGLGATADALAPGVLQVGLR